MASVWKHPNSKFWSACFRLPDGSRTKRTTKETDRKKAEETANKLEALSRRTITAVQARKVISDIYKISTGEELSQFTPRTYLEKWHKTKTPEIGNNTAEKYAATIAEFLAFLGDKSDKDLLRLTMDDVQGFRDACAQKSSAKTANNKLVIIRQGLNAAWQDGHLPENISDRVRKLKLQGRQQTRHPFTLQQVRQIYAHASGEWKGMILMGSYTGQRLGDIATLKWRNLDERSMALHIVSEKQHRPTVVPLVGPLAAWVKAAPKNRKPDDAVFPEANATVQKNKSKVSALSKQFHSILVAVGLATHRERQPQGKGRHARRTINPLSFHSFRHTLTSELKEAGSGAAVAQDIVGHDSASVSEQYTHVAEDVKRLYLEKLPDITATHSSSKRNKPKPPRK